MYHSRHCPAGRYKQFAFKMFPSVRESVSAIYLDASVMATNVRVETIPGITSTSGAAKPPALNGAIASNSAGPQSHSQDAAAGSSDPRPVVRCDRCRLVQFRA